MTFLRLYWQYIVMAIMAGIIGIQELEIKQLKIDELQAKVKVVEHIVTVQGKRNEIANNRPDDKSFLDGLLDPKIVW